MGGIGAGNSPNSSVWFGATLPTLPTTFTTVSAPPAPASTNRGSYYTPGVGADASLDLQTALNDAAAATGSNGDVIVLQAATTYTTTGSFTLPARSGSGWIYIISSDAPEVGGTGLPAAGTRATPSDVQYMPKLRTSAANGGYVFQRAAGPGVSQYRLVGLDVELTDANISGGVNYYVVSWDQGDTKVSTLAQDITIDRCYIAGSPTYGVTHAIRLEGIRVEVTECSVCDYIFSYGNGDTNAITVFNSTGPYRIHNNYLSAIGETTIFGGSDTQLPEPSEPSDIEVTNNSYYKNFFSATGSVASGSTTLTITAVASRVVSANGIVKGYVGPMMIPADADGNIPHGNTTTYIVKQLTSTEGDSSLGGMGTYEMSQAATGTTSGTVAISGVNAGKNMMEFKTGRRVLFQSNYLENAGTEGQARSAFVLTSRNQDGANPWYQLADFTIEQNFFTNCQFGGIDILLQDNIADYNFDTQPAERILIRNNLFILSVNDGTSGTSAMLLMSANPAAEVLMHFTGDVTGLSAGTLTAPVNEGIYTGMMGYAGNGSFSPWNYTSGVTITVGDGKGPGTSTSATWTGTYTASTTPTPIIVADVAPPGPSYGGGSDFIFDHNTIVCTAAAGMNTYLGLLGIAVERFVFTNNIWGSSQYGIDGASGVSVWGSVVPPQVTDWAFGANVIVGNDSTIPTSPIVNYQPAANADIGFTSFGSTSLAAGYVLASGSPYKGKGVSGLGLAYDSAGSPDGTDLGCNITLLPTA